MNLHVITPYSPDKDYLGAINDTVQHFPDEDYFVVFDHDTMITTNNWYKTILKAIEDTEEKFFTCLTNRVGCLWQIDENAPKGDDIKEHWDYGNKLEKQNEGKYVNRTLAQLFSGMMWVMEVKTWKELDVQHEGTLGLDNAIHEKAGRSGVHLTQILGMYVYHRYRFGEQQDTSHLDWSPVVNRSKK